MQSTTAIPLGDQMYRDLKKLDADFAMDYVIDTNENLHTIAVQYLTNLGLVASDIDSFFGHRKPYIRIVDTKDGPKRVLATRAEIAPKFIYNGKAKRATTGFDFFANFLAGLYQTPINPSEEFGQIKEEYEINGRRMNVRVIDEKMDPTRVVLLGPIGAKLTDYKKDVYRKGGQQPLTIVVETNRIGNLVDHYLANEFKGYNYETESAQATAESMVIDGIRDDGTIIITPHTLVADIIQHGTTAKVNGLEPLDVILPESRPIEVTRI